MRVALMSDIHANLPALEACLDATAKLDVGRLVFLGDFVGYGPDPEAVVKRIASLVEGGAIAVLGNHDKAVLTSSRDLNLTAAQAIAWTRDQLSETSKAFLGALPLEVRSNDVLFVHADASDPAAWHYVVDAEAARVSLSGCQALVTFCGHVHVPAVYCLSATGKMISHAPVTGVSIPILAQRRWLAVMGAVGQPRDGNPAASFAVYDTATHALTYHRAPYDAESVASRIRDAGLPASLADRIVRGR
ncbi:MAG: metallophosphoesterase family protein [Aestuariivirga sp.]